MEGGIMTAVQTTNPVPYAEGALEAGIHEVGATIDAVEREVGRGVSTRFPLNSAFIFTFGALGGMLFGFDTGIISGASPLIESDFGLSVAQTGFITSSVLIGSEEALRTREKHVPLACASRFPALKNNR